MKPGKSFITLKLYITITSSAHYHHNSFHNKYTKVKEENMSIHLSR